MKLSGKSNVVIRTAEQLKSMNPNIVKALEDASCSKGKIDIPVVYQYLHKPGTPFIASSENTIGHITKISQDFKGDYIGEIYLISLMKLASNYMGVIDNIVVSLNQLTNNIKIDGFIVYDKTAKLKVLSNKKKASNITHSPKVGEIPLAISNTIENSELMKEASKLLIDEFNKKMSEEEQSDKSEN